MHSAVTYYIIYLHEMSTILYSKHQYQNVQQRYLIDGLVDFAENNGELRSVTLTEQLRIKRFKKLMLEQFVQLNLRMYFTPPPHTPKKIIPIANIMIVFVETIFPLF